MNFLRTRGQLTIIAFVLLATGAGLAARPVAHGILGKVSAARAKAIWGKWKGAHADGIDMASARPGQPVFWLRVPSCKISTLVLQESDANALHRFPAVRRLNFGGLVVFAHRDLHFRALANISLDDEIEMESANGSSDFYRVKSIRILLPEEVSATLDSQENGDLLYLLTCYPFRYIGPAPKHFLMSAIRCSE